MTLTDAGPLVAIVDEHDRYHDLCQQALAVIQLPFVTTVPVLTETMYFLGTRIGWKAQSQIWRLVSDGRMLIQPIDAVTLSRMEVLMARYADTPMDFADASLVAAAEETNNRVIFTLDEHFRAYRMHGREPFDILPKPEGR